MTHRVSVVFGSKGEGVYSIPQFGGGPIAPSPHYAAALRPSRCIAAANTIIGRTITATAAVTTAAIASTVAAAMAGAVAAATAADDVPGGCCFFFFFVCVRRGPSSQ